ncbi:hypothetical protein AVEN_233163-1 [Araneus ventricosus]|uniref:Uncharacterized protein n=1 Tax=Araneus ventricosus TaxID=182803 RepID=A0A4Y2EHJ2_ARAVE|nr:hypothetical protein AVEN_233163-1 [Araneus ventricosus]
MNLIILNYTEMTTSEQLSGYSPSSVFHSTPTLDVKFHVYRDNPFPCFRKRSNLYHTNRGPCREVGNPLLFATSCPLTVSFQTNENQVIISPNIGGKAASPTNTQYPVNFLTDNEAMFKLDPGIDSNFSDSDSDI